MDGLKFIKQLRDVHKVIPNEADYNVADVLFKDGNAGMIINGDWSLGDYTKALGDKMGVAPVPTINGKPYTEMTAGKYFMVSTAAAADPGPAALRLPMRQAACRTIATTTGFTPESAPAIAGTWPQRR